MHTAGLHWELGTGVGWCGDVVGMWWGWVRMGAGMGAGNDSCGWDWRLKMFVFPGKGLGLGFSLSGGPLALRLEGCR